MRGDNEWDGVKVRDVEWGWVDVRAGEWGRIANEG